MDNKTSFEIRRVILDDLREFLKASYSDFKVHSIIGCVIGPVHFKFYITEDWIIDVMKVEEEGKSPNIAHISDPEYRQKVLSYIGKELKNTKRRRLVIEKEFE